MTDKEKPEDVVTFRVEYPVGRVADHEVFMSFNSDSNAEVFCRWWDDQGEKAYLAYRAKAVKP